MRRKGVSALEYGILMIITIAAFTVMTNFFRRSVSAKWREAADGIGFYQQYYDPTE